MDEEEMAKGFEEATWHSEHHNWDLNYVGKFRLSQRIRDNGFKVILSGEGSDEHFAGYPFFIADFLREADRTYSGPTVREVEREKLRERQESTAAEAYTRIGARALDRSEPELRAASEMMGGICTPAMISAISVAPFAAWAKRAYPQHTSMTAAKSFTEHVRERMRTSWHPLHSALYTFCKGHLLNNFLSCLGDRTEMAHSIESRPAFLDHVFTEYVNNLPPSVKNRYDPVNDKFLVKWIQAEAVRPFVTDELYHRKKQPYMAPPKWPPNGPLQHLFERLITEENVRQLGFVDCDLAKTMVYKAFVESDMLSMRSCFFVAQWVILAQRFGIPTARPRGKQYIVSS
jgi:asparagine synthase (glutamine-hydrolysing)